MAKNTVTVQREIPVTAGFVYGLIRDYRNHHSKFLPSAFENYRVDMGGIGAGTIVSFDLKAGGRVRSYRMEIEEPQFGHRLVEKDVHSSLVTTWSVLPNGQNAIVRIESTWDGAKGIGGFFERIFAPKAMKSLYEDELARLEEYANSSAARS
jgi:hypothetical protein